MKHNKKRNAALIYEQLIRYISRALVEGKTEKARVANEILSEHFARGSELYKEFRLFNSLMRTTVDSRNLAERIVAEARNAAKDHNAVKLDKEKSRLIASVNKRLNESGFYDIRIPEYRQLATVQQLLNGWRGAPMPIEKLVEHESKTVDLLMSEKSLPPLVVSEGVNDLTLRIMKKKFTERMNENLTRDQLKILTYAARGDTKSLVPLLDETKRETLNSLNELRSSAKNQTVKAKVDSVSSVISALDPRDLSESNVARFLVMKKLVEEIREGEDEA